MANTGYIALQSALAERYRIERELGAGGMATVFLAQDLRHDRRVAIKVLKPELAAVLGADRFVVEIKTTAALQHPHILPLFDSGTADGQLYYVMPYIQGETIREKLNRETQFGIDDAIRIAREVADALDYAHRSGVIHRDIKPENILLHDGRAMVMDFGIALAVSAAAGGRLTETGLSLGTPHYMSPEQATAEKEITPRSDVYSLASVLYEMLAGQPPHIGGSAQAVIMKIITEQAQSVRQLRKNVPPNVDAALSKALEKLPADRFQSAKAFSDALVTPTFSGASTFATPAAVGPTRALTTYAPLAASAALALVGLGAAGWAWQHARGGVAEPVVALTLNVPSGNPDLGRFAISPNGDHFAFTTDEGLFVRDATSRDYRLMPGTARAESPSFSPDGQWIAFEDQGHLRKIAIAGGSAIPLIADDTLSAGRLHWGMDGSIVFMHGAGMVLIPANGGPPRALSKARSAESPRLVPDGSGVLFVDTQRGSKLKFYDLRKDTAYTVLEESSEAQYLPTGHLLFVAPTGGLFAVRFDLARHATSGSPVPVAADLQANGGVGPFAVSASGTLVYRSGIDQESRLLMRDPRGKVDTLPVPPNVVGYVRFAPDGRKLAITVGSARGTNRYTALYDLSLGSMSRFTDQGGGHSPIWSPDGTRLAFTAEDSSSDAEDIFVQPVDRSTKPVRLFRLPNDQHATAWPMDTMLVFASQSAPQTLGATGAAGGGVAASMRIVNPSSPGPTRDYLKSQWDQYDAAISPDGQWAAFTSLESGAPEIVVRRFPNANESGMWKVSSTSGRAARWSGDGKIIYYQEADGSGIRAVHVTPGAKFEVGKSEVVMALPNMGTAWDVDRRTGNIIVAQGIASARVQIVVMQHWLESFSKQAPGAK